MKKAWLALMFVTATSLLGCDCEKCKECAKAAECSNCAACKECATCKECASDKGSAGGGAAPVTTAGAGGAGPVTTTSTGGLGNPPGAPQGVQYRTCTTQQECIDNPPPSPTFDSTCSKSAGVCLGGWCRAVLQAGKHCHKGSSTPCLKSDNTPGTAQCISSGTDKCGWDVCQ